MRLTFGSFEVDTKGLPRVFSIRADRSYSTERQIDVYILLDGYTRSVVAKWANRLGVEIVDLPLYQSRPGGEWVQTWEAVREFDGYKLRVWTSRTVEAPACPCECTAAFCRCSDPETCSCKPACPVCDKDGGE